mgnify:CR=1 FL=1
MSNDNVLKKQFKKQDVERIRNLVKGKSGDRITVGIGYNGETQKDHIEGDIWEQDGKTWTIRDGIKENITKLDKFKHVSVPIFCPNCNTVMDKQLDTHYYKAYGECLDCRTKTETKLKLEGKWKNHTYSTYNKELDEYIKSYKSFMDDALKEDNESFVSENGEVQKWIGGVDKNRAKNAMESFIKHLESLKKDIQN